MPFTAASIPLLSIPAYYLVALAPHFIANAIATRGLGRHDNRNYHSANYVDKIKKSLSPRDFGRYERAKRAQANNLENLPLFLAGIFSGLWAESIAGSGSVGLNTFAISFVILRGLYTVNYVVTETQQWSFLRTGLYVIGTSWVFKVVVQSAAVLGGSA